MSVIETSERVLFAKNNIIGQFVFVGIFIVRKVLLQRFANLQNRMYDAIHHFVFSKLLKHCINCILPVLITRFLMNAFIGKKGHLPVFHRNVKQHCIAQCCFIHLQRKENFFGSIESVNIAAFAFYKQAQFAAGLLLGSLYSSYNAMLLFSSKKDFLFLPK